MEGTHKPLRLWFRAMWDVTPSFLRAETGLGERDDPCLAKLVVVAELVLAKSSNGLPGIGWGFQIWRCPSVPEARQPLSRFRVRDSIVYVGLKTVKPLFESDSNALCV